ncbi:MAG: DUF1570 domain-containing protein [Pirellula sp.]|jgi:hypothetical protein|nr:DUF1570 domain-containing protein [Pirellula sp.]
MQSHRKIPWSLIACIVMVASTWGVVQYKLKVGESNSPTPNSNLLAESFNADSNLPPSEQFVKLRSDPRSDQFDIDSAGATIRSEDAKGANIEPVADTVALPTTEIATTYGTFYGLPMARFSDQYWLLRNDGAIQSIPNDIIQTERSMPVDFRVISVDQLMTDLRDEFGNHYLVHHQKPYVFVAKSEHMGQWAARFRALYESMRRVCMTKGLSGTDIEFPLVAIVFGSKDEFLRYASRANVALPDNCVGYYSQRDNRIALYEDDSEATAQDTLDTISHESAHQLAFNMGLHRRCVSSGLWLPEGFATLFESPAFSNISREGRSSWPAARIETWRKIHGDREKLAEALDSIVRNDNLFTHDPDLAYTVSWALTYHLMEKEPRRFADYVHQTGQLPLGHELASIDRWHHFRSVFGREPAQYAPLIQKHLSGIR